MKELESVLAGWSTEVYKFILSNPVAGCTYKKVVGNRTSGEYLVEQYTQTQVFHRKIGTQELAGYLAEMLGGSFKQCNGWDSVREYSIRISSKGKLLCTTHAVAGQAPQQAATHNRTKNYILAQGTAIAPLVDMGIFTAQGRVVQPMYDKYRQINRFIEIIDDEVAKLDTAKPLHIIDFGCGKSYLTFILYYYLTQLRGFTVEMTGLDLKKDVIEKCATAAERYGYTGLHFELGDINGYKPAAKVDMVVTLHACDTATDYALYNAVQWGARLIFSVPCCQHELNGQIESEALGLLTRYGIVKERVAALMTDAIRANLLEVAGYRTQLLEFVDMEHTPKNILIRAVKKQGTQQSTQKAMGEVERLMAEFHLKPTLYRLLHG